MKHFLLSIFLIICCSSFSLFAQQKTITGQVKDDAGQPLPGVSILLKGTQTGTLTNEQGQYELDVYGEHPVLIFSFQGYQRKEVTINNVTTVNLSMAVERTELEEVVVTASRSPRLLEEVPQKVKVITQEEIEKTIAVDLTDLVKKTAGVDVIQYPGMLSGIGIRGFRPQFSGINQTTLLLIDGRPAGATNLATIDMSNVQRVEVLKGPASSLYGAQAMGGVVNLITRKTTGKTGGSVQFGKGSYDATTGGFSFGGSLTKKLDVDAGFNFHNQADNYKLGKGNLFRDVFSWDQADRIRWTAQGKKEEKINDVQRDGETRPYTSFNRYTSSLRIGYDLNDQWRIDVKGDRFYAKDVNTPDNIENQQQTPGLKDLDRFGGDITVKGFLSKNTHMLTRLFASREKNKGYNVSLDASGAVRSEYVRNNNEFTWLGSQWQVQQTIGKHTLIAGVDYTNTEQNNLRFNSAGVAQKVSAKSPNFNLVNTGIFGQGDLSWFDNTLNLTMGLRYEHIQYNIQGTELFSSRNETSRVINPSVGARYKFTPTLSAHTTFGTGFTTVGIFEFAGYSESKADSNPNDGVDTVDVYRGNPSLKNQSSKTFDLGIRYDNVKGFSVDITYFRTRLENNVVTQVIQYPGTFAESGAVIRNLNTYKNAQGTTLSGLEVETTYPVTLSPKHSFLFSLGSVVILQAYEIREVYLQPAPLTLNMQNVADLTLNYGISYHYKKWFSTRLSGRYVGRRYDTDWSYYLGTDNETGDYADVLYPSFMTLDLATSFQKDQHEISLLIGNLTDENYYEKRGYNLMGRNFMIRYKLKF